jgi:hypothetical protein
MLTYPTPRRPPCPPSRSPGDRWSLLSRGLDVPNLTKRCGRFVSTTPCPRRFDLRLHIHREHEAGKTESSSSSPCTAVVAILRCFVSPTKSLCRRETCSCFAPPHPLLRTSVTQQPLPLQQRPCPSSVLARVWISSPHTLHLLSHAAVAPSTPTIVARRSALGLHDAPYTQWRGANFLATGEHNGHGGGRPSLCPAAGPRRKAANDTVVSCSLFPSYCSLHLFLKFSKIPNPKFPLYLCNPGPGHRTTEERPGARQPGPQDAVAHLPSSIPKCCHASNFPPHSFPCYLWSLDLTLRVFRCVTGAHPVPEADLVVPPRWRGHRRRRDPRATQVSIPQGRARRSHLLAWA